MKSNHVVLLLGALLAGCASGRSATVSRQALVDKLAADGRFTKVTQMLNASDLKLPSESCTVFVPTDEAFARLDKGVVERGLKPENRERLRTELEFHVLPEKLTKAMLGDRDTVDTAAGYPISIKRKDQRLIVGNALLTEADIDFENGLIHVIDSVLRPPAGFRKPKAPLPSRKVQPDQWWW